MLTRTPSSFLLPSPQDNTGMCHSQPDAVFVYAANLFDFRKWVRRQSGVRLTVRKDPGASTSGAEEEGEEQGEEAVLAVLLAYVVSTLHDSTGRNI